ncbi:hydroxyethylthiazole kinase [Herbaspirillum rubrisubalbicans]|uniref:peptidoglycan DD-metalloendopeptidase family protein n=1 Tax=Herbaspirillum rubrisubalbicans TaxID=80842 RepID=UPI00209E552A|nr:peptidoglycan DD-metalloendopeptidase family protein [Herbaspirillum rubrisubalbicans]MCP1575556.1 hydroxyethylthiazole kinase [Herbaspirillum rubrisubalbicans]
MLLSPPFLPPRSNDLSDAAWHNTLLPDPAAGAGLFPISRDLNWHGGLHIEAPPDANGTEWVHAIADGTIIFSRSATRKNDDTEHPLNYLGWTDDGCIVIRHETDIGEGEAATGIVFYSLYMHLSQVEAALKPGKRIYRKDLLGIAGQSHNSSRKLIHFEIVCDDDNLKKLVGRSDDKLDLSRDGRTDALFGEMYFLLPAGTRLYAKEPPRHQSVPEGETLQVTEEVLIVGLRYAEGDGAPAQRGDLLITTYRPDGERIGQSIRLPEAEYLLYASANKISTAYPEGKRPAPSAIYELLRFGRIVGPDILDPVDVPHWREMELPNGRGWINLNAPDVRKYSDADFPPWQHWHLVKEEESSRSQDSRCSVAAVSGWLDLDGDGEITEQEALAALDDQRVRHRLSRLICRVESEWDASRIEDRWSWLTRSENDVPASLNAKGFEQFKIHAKALCVEHEEFLEAKWRFNPREFLALFRRNRWMSLQELIQTIPRKVTLEKQATNFTWQTVLKKLRDGTTKAGKLKFPAGIYLSLPKLFRKYFFATSPLRAAHFLSQALVETGTFSASSEFGDPRYFRTMYEVITPQECAEDHDNQRSVAWRLRYAYKPDGTKYTREEYQKIRPPQVKKKAGQLGNVQPGDGERFKGRGIIQLTGRANYAQYSHYRGKDFTGDFGEELIGSDIYNALDSAFKYWIAKTNPKMNINRYADQGTSKRQLTLVTRSVNGGTTHIDSRAAYLDHLSQFFGDEKYRTELLIKLQREE